MRTVRRCIRDLNKEKQATLEALLKAYAAEKRHWLKVFEQKDDRVSIKQPRLIRDAAVATGYEPASKLQARMWKLALNDAAETWDKYWQALFVKLRSRIWRRDFNEEGRHYLFWLLADYRRFFTVLTAAAPVPTFAIEESVRSRLGNYLRRQVRRLRGRSPQQNLARSVALDANCYTIFEEGGRQYLKIMTMERGQRLVLPLLGWGPVAGNIRIVKHSQNFEVHLTQKIKGARCEELGSPMALDFGYTEAFTDNEGEHYGIALGAAITKASEDRHRKGRERNKLSALAKSYAQSQNPRQQRKARNIYRYNLGRQKWVRREERAKATIAREINTGLNKLARTKSPALVVTEDLSHAFTFDKPKTWNRRLSAWTRGVIQSRVQFKALTEGFRHEQVNPAYSSQTCPVCGFVDSGNRKGDVFVCLHCGHENHADRVGALNLLGRVADRQITRYTPYREVKAILLGRFLRRLEADGTLVPEATVPGRTPETDSGMHSPFPTRQKSQRVRCSALHPTVTRRAKQKDLVQACE